MRKIVAAFFIILILGGAAFFFGWAQFRVPPGSYGVMRSKTHGVDPVVLREGEFRWFWYAVIPTNVEIAVFTPHQVERPVSITGSLRSGGIYASFAGIEADFSYEYSGSVSFMVNPGKMPFLMTQRGIANQEDLAALEQRTAGEIASFSALRLEEYAGESEERLEPIVEKLKGDILQAYPYIENLYCSIRLTRSPDFALYRSVRKIYEDYLAEQQRTLAASISSSAQKHIDARLRFDELAKYGELLTQYPILLQYLALEKGEGREMPALNGN
jgi:hypothetical protein